MKRSLSWLLVALFLVSCGGGDDGAGPGDGGNNNTDPTPTTPGTPIGTATTQPIGPGGTVTSADGLFSITIPPGALPAGPASASGTRSARSTARSSRRTASSSASVINTSRRRAVRHGGEIKSR